MPILTNAALCRIPRQFTLTEWLAALAAHADGEFEGWQVSRVAALFGFLRIHDNAYAPGSDDQTACNEAELKFLSDIVTIWKHRAALMYANSTRFLPTSGVTFRADILGAEAEYELEKLFGDPGDTATLATLSGKVEEAREACKEWVRKYEMPGKNAPPIPPEKDPYRAPYPARDLVPVTKTVCALLSATATVSEGCLTRFVAGMTGGKIEDRVSVRGIVRDMIHEGYAIGVQFDAEPKAIEAPEINPEHFPVSCAVCRYRFKIQRSISMKHGFNRGHCTCSACRRFLNVRAMNGDFLTADGVSLRTFREWEEPEAMFPQEGVFVQEFPIGGRRADIETPGETDQ